MISTGMVIGMMDEKLLIRSEADRIGIDVLGFASCEPFLEIEDILKDREKKGYLSGFEEKDIKKRIYINNLLKDCRTIISAGISYNAVCSQKNKNCDCTISMCSWGIDYHTVLREKLNCLGKFIADRFNCSVRIFVDTGPVIEREAARRAGVGFTGKNCSIINPEYGSFIFLGEIITDLSLKPDAPISSGCGDCDICMESCPTGALCAPYTVNAKKCRSYLTQSKDISLMDYKKIGCSIYGCDVCQRVCPKNKNAAIANHDEFIPEEWNRYPDPAAILNTDRRGFDKTFKTTSSGWRGRKILQRNALIALSNSKDKVRAAEQIKISLKDERKYIRKAAVLALYNLLGEESLTILRGALDAESDEDNKNLILQIIYGEQLDN